MVKTIFHDTVIKIQIFLDNTDYNQTFPSEEKLQIIQEFHENKLGGNLGVARTVKRIKLNFNWKGLKLEV